MRPGYPSPAIPGLAGSTARPKVLHVVPTFFPATHFGGPIYSLLGLCNALARSGGTDFRVLTTDSGGPSRQNRLDIQCVPVRRPEDYEVYYCRKVWGEEFSVSLLLRLYPMIRWADVVHLTSVYSFSTIPTLFLCRLLRKPVVWSPRGALQRWGGSTRPILKRIWESICNGVLSPRRSVLHVTSQDEAKESQRRITRARIAIVENGVDIPADISSRVWAPDGVPRLLFIGRLHPKKGIENLFQALKTLDEKINLSVCGTGDPEYVSSLRMLASELGLSDRVHFVDHVEGKTKTRAFRDADICVVPSFTENFAMVVAESLAHGVPVVASKGTPWQALNERGCGEWVDNDPFSLAKAIIELSSRDLAAMGERGREWMKREYAWPVMADRMLSLYRSLAEESVQ